MLIGISRQPCAVEFVDKPAQSAENYAIARSLAGAGYTDQLTHQFGGGASDGRRGRQELRVYVGGLDSGLDDINPPPGFWEGATLPGRQLNFSIRGEQYEKAFDGIASRFLSVVRVPRPDDYGIDAYCHILRPLDAISSTAEGTFGVQIRGPGRNLQLRRMTEIDTACKAFEIEWLGTLAVPL